jgi:hypothetical protein
MREFFNAKIKLLDPCVDRFPWTDRQHYAQFLAQTYYYVAHSTRLLALAAARFGADREELHRRFIKHIAEENAHHLLAEKDLKHLDLRVEGFEELPMTKALYEAQYFKVEHQDPTVLFGYILALEGLSIHRGEAIHDWALEAFGKKSTHFVRLHSREDPDHLEKAFEHIEQLPEHQQKWIRDNFVQSCLQYDQFLAGIQAALAR